MEETPGNRPPQEPVERIEHHEGIERVRPGEPVRRRAGTPMWAWLLPLVLVAGLLAWYVFTRGEPDSPLDEIDSIEIDAPDLEVPTPSIENQTIIEVPEASLPEVQDPAPAGEAAGTGSG